MKITIEINKAEENMLKSTAEVHFLYPDESEVHYGKREHHSHRGEGQGQEVRG